MTIKELASLPMQEISIPLYAFKHVETGKYFFPSIKDLPAFLADTPSFVYWPDKANTMEEVLSPQFVREEVDKPYGVHDTPYSALKAYHEIILNDGTRYKLTDFPFVDK
jgi:hypothetical protein